MAPSCRQASRSWLRARHFDHERIGADVDDVGPVDVDQLHDLEPCLRGGFTLISARSRITVGWWVTSCTAMTLTSLNRLFATMAALVLLASTTMVMRECRGFGVADGQAFDVEAAAAEQAGHAGQHAGLVLHQRHQDMGDWLCRWCDPLGHGQCSFRKLPACVHLTARLRSARSPAAGSCRSVLCRAPPSDKR